MPLLQITFSPNTDFNADNEDLPTIHTVVSDGTNSVEQDISGDVMAGYLSDVNAFKSQIVRPAFKKCRMATALVNSFIPLQAVNLDEGTIETEVLEALLLKIPE